MSDLASAVALYTEWDGRAEVDPAVHPWTRNVRVDGPNRYPDGTLDGDSTPRYDGADDH